MWWSKFLNCHNSTIIGVVLPVSRNCHVWRSMCCCVQVWVICPTSDKRVKVEHIISMRIHCLKVLGKSVVSLLLVWLFNMDAPPSSSSEPTPWSQSPVSRKVSTKSITWDKTTVSGGGNICEQWTGREKKYAWWRIVIFLNQLNSIRKRCKSKVKNRNRRQQVSHQ